MTWLFASENYADTNKSSRDGTGRLLVDSRRTNFSDIFIILRYEYVWVLLVFSLACSSLPTWLSDFAQKPKVNL